LPVLLPLPETIRKGKCSPPAAEATGRVFGSPQLLAYHIVSQDLPVVAGIPEALGPSSLVLRLGTSETTLILDDSGSFLKSVDVRDGC
jgi:hypothetical protein